jgi:quinol monooxygenase YgiN
MTVHVLLEFKVSPQRRNEAVRLFRELLPSTRAFAGCKRVTGHLDQADGTILLIEEWESKEHQQKYLAWRMTTEHGKQLIALLDAPPALHFYDPLDV